MEAIDRATPALLSYTGLAHRTRWNRELAAGCNPGAICGSGRWVSYW